MSDSDLPHAGADGAAALHAAQRPRRGDELELEIQTLAYGGEGVARLGEGGYVVFVAGAIPGDRVRAHVYKSKRAYAHARSVELLSPSPQRIAPRAEHPGVPWQVLPYEYQLEVKRSQVEDALRRIGKLDSFELEQIVPAVQHWRYRNKLEFSFGSDPGGRLVCGFHAPARWNRVEHIEDCLLASERSNQARRVAYTWCCEQGLSAWERAARPSGRRGETGAADGPSAFAREQRTGPGPGGRAQLRNLVVREGRRTGKLQVRIVSTDGELDVAGLAQALREHVGEQTLSGVLWSRSRQLGETTAGGETELLWGEAELAERICELDVRIPAEAFFQTNTEMAEVLYGIAAEYAQLQGWERVYDLYCGLGTIALTLARRAGEVWGVELSEEALAGALAAAERNGIDNVRFRAGEVRRVLDELLREAGRPDAVIVDPPRAGLGRKSAERVMRAAPKRIVYVSCNPTTLASDAALFSESGWTLERVRPVDMFPQTHHIECVAALRRRA
jgi:23S rRNA (uracil1939-C5)-methyltransferase